ncbi:centriole and centriolar satellite protein OFD1-like isoform X3 [Babylonia areolata]|uniref:centriole and centriolar satellite protein OFD1-like isoform X3 n=1 Tax=Babylonia areolata TaxID=304850 RepID=UPI003FD41F5C
MADKVPEYLSAEELRNRLYHSLRNRGLVNSIKSQLRTNLITELQSVQGPLTLHDLEPQESDPLILRAANSLVADHMRRAKYEYSLGVFLPESGLSQDKIFQPEDLMRLLHISPQSRLYKQLWSKADAQTDKGLLWQILTELSALHSRASQDTGTQVDLTRAGPVTSLDAKLHSLEELYSSKRDGLSRSSHSAVEERLLSYQRQLEDRYNSQLKLELARLKDSEIACMKMEEKENGRKELEKSKRELQRTYQEKYDQLVERERNSIERLQKEQELQEKEVYSQRQMLLSEIESIRQREAEVKREAEVNKREKQLTEDRNKAKEDELRRREVELRNKEIQFEQRLQNEMAQFKLDQQAKFIERVQNVEVREAKVKEEERIVAEEKSKVQSLKDDLRDKTHRVNELESTLQEARHSEVSATRQNEFINAKLRDMADYKTIKEQSVSQRNELETLRTRLSELLTMNERERGRQEELLRELRRPSPETLMLQRDLERARENLRQEQVVYEQQKQLLESRLKDEVDRNRELVQRLEEQVLQMKEMNREVVDLRKQLAMTQTVLNNEVYRKPKDDGNGRSRSPLHMSHHSLGDGAHQSLRAVSATLDPRGSRGPVVAFGADRDVYNDIDSDLDLGPISRRRNMSELSDDHSSAASADIVAETRYRLRGLEKEAQNLERAYHDFHCHMTNVNALPSDAPPPPPSSHPPVNTSHRSQGLAAVTAQRAVVSPPASPIPHDRPMSSTPYKRRPDPSLHDDSFAELSGGKLQEPRTAPPHFDLSNVSDEADEKQAGETKHVKSRPITVDDLEARPGSPSMLVVAESESAGSPPQQEEAQPKPAKLDPLPSQPTTEKATSSAAPSLSLDAAWKQPSVSLDDAWKKPASSLGAEREAERKKEEEERRRKEEEERRREEEERRRKEEEERRRKEEEEEERRKEEQRKKEEEKAAQEAGGIDPVMLQYMAKVQAMKEQEKQAPKETKSTAGKVRSPSQSDISVVDDAKSERDDFDDDIW